MTERAINPSANVTETYVDWHIVTVKIGVPCGVNAEHVQDTMEYSARAVGALVMSDYSGDVLCRPPEASKPLSQKEAPESLQPEGPQLPPIYHEVLGLITQRRMDHYELTFHSENKKSSG